MQTFKKALIIGAFLIVLALIGIIIDAYSMSASKVTYSGTNTPNEYLTQHNASFEQAILAQNAHNYTLAKQYYEDALQSATDPIQAQQIKYAIVSMTEESGDYTDAIQMYKQIANDTSNYTILRAYAAQQVGLIYYMYYNTDRSALVKNAFDSAPYSSFFATSSISLSYKNLFQYAASIYPLGQSESRVAYWYAQQVAAMHSTTSPTAVADLSTMNQDFALANADSARALQDPGSQRMVPSVYMFEGLSYALLQPLGAASSTQVEAAFSRAVSLANSMTYDGYERFYYAEYLLNTYGTARSSDIQSLLAPFTTTNTASIDPPVATYFASVRTNPSTPVTKNVLIKMGNLEPSFKAYLISLGWKASDFSGTANSS